MCAVAEYIKSANLEIYAIMPPQIQNPCLTQGFKMNLYENPGSDQGTIQGLDLPNYMPN